VPPGADAQHRIMSGGEDHALSVGPNGAPPSLPLCKADDFMSNL
jgi:hypothetical protein